MILVKNWLRISEILDATPKMLDLVYADLTRESRKDTGREGMTAEQVLRCVALKQFRNLSYEELAFHLEDSKSFRAFARLEMGQYPSSSLFRKTSNLFPKRPGRQFISASCSMLWKPA